MDSKNYSGKLPWLEAEGGSEKEEFMVKSSATAYDALRSQAGQEWRPDSQGPMPPWSPHRPKPVNAALNQEQTEVICLCFRDKD